MSDIEIIEVVQTTSPDNLEVTQGIVAIPGPIGPEGPAGRDGIDGAPGANGRDGAVGPAGPIGPQGLPGPAGRDGRDGVDGDAGPVGPKGDRGDAGAAGAQGPQGVPGERGADGAPGPTGPQGLKGDKGDTGAQGPQGIQGERGADGAAGIDGQDGAPGSVGPQGPQGLTGPQGPKGDTGATGATGPQGPKGDTGATGPQGPAGTSGTTTIPGSAGSIQYKSGTTLAADTNLVYRPTERAIQLGTTVIKPMQLAQHPFAQITGFYALEGNRTLGAHQGFTSTREWQASDGTQSYNRALTYTTTGTPTAQAIADSRWLAEPAINYVSDAAPGSQASFVNTNGVVLSATGLTGGFVVIVRMGVKDWTPGKRWFVGLSADASAPGDVDPGTLPNTFGIGVGAGDTVLNYFGRANGVLTKQATDIGANLGGANLTFVFKSNPGEKTIYCGLFSGGYSYGGLYSGLPAGVMYPKAYVGNGATTTPITLSMNRVYVEYLTDF